MYNEVIKKINLKINFRNRVKSKTGDWVIDSFYLKVNPVE